MITTLLLGLLLRFEPPAEFPSIDPALVKEITHWKKGTPPPRKLLQFPKGPLVLSSGIALPPGCMGIFGDDVRDYIFPIGNVDLLKALLFDPDADTSCIRAASGRLIERLGLQKVRTLIADRRKSSPRDFTRTELATLAQLVISPYVQIRVASLDKEDITRDVAEKVLASLKVDLTSGVPWKQAYLKAADLVPDVDRSKTEDGERTYLCYRYAGLVSPTGFDLLDRRISDELNSEHLRSLFDLKGKFHLIETKDRYWFYYVEGSYE